MEKRFRVGVISMDLPHPCLSATRFACARYHGQRGAAPAGGEVKSRDSATLFALFGK